MKTLSRFIFSLVIAGLIFPVLPNFVSASSSALTITSPIELPSGKVGKSYSYQFKAKGGEAPYTWELSNLPAYTYHCCLIGFSSTGKFASVGDSGFEHMPYSGDYQIAVKVTDRNGASVEQVHNYTIKPASSSSKPSSSNKYRLGKIENISATSVSGWAYDNDQSVKVDMVVQRVDGKKKTYKFKTTPTITRTDVGTYISNQFNIGGITVPLGFSFNPSEKITIPGTYKIKSIKFNHRKFEFGVDPKTTFTIQ